MAKKTAKKTTTTKPVAVQKKKTTAKVVAKAKTKLKEKSKSKPETKTLAKNIKEERVEQHTYPIGRFKQPAEFNETVITKLIQDIRILPEHLKTICKKVNKKKKLQYTYREGGWNIEQIVHHIGDSHMNALVRFKLALTENNPTIKPYDHNLWTETADIQLPVKNSVRLVKAVHAKWVALLENMDKNDWKRTFYHPEYKRTSSLQETLALYAWHGKHHVAQIEIALKNN
jgi:uncharacterized damage-inducible protein DinB